MNQLMVDLGFGSGYIVQGGDIGSRVAKTLGGEYEACKVRAPNVFRYVCLGSVVDGGVAVHVNYSPERSPPEGIAMSSLTAKEKEGLKRGEDFVKMGAAYSLEHAARPSTIGLVLGSSPMALLAWIGEKFLAWSDVDPGLGTILESVTLYWLTETFPMSIYPYRLVCIHLPISAVDWWFRLITCTEINRKLTA